jgi:hypothetical protein
VCVCVCVYGAGTAKTLGTQGGSNGGLLMGNMLTRAPVRKAPSLSAMFLVLSSSLSQPVLT